MTFVVDRVLHLVAMVLGALVLTFMLIRASADPVSVMLPAFATPAERQALREHLGLDDSLPAQFSGYVVRAAQGDFGNSWRYHQPALQLVVSRLPATFALVIVSLLLALAIGIGAGVAAAIRMGGALDAFVLGSSLIARAIPTFWLGTLLILLFSVELGWLPTSGYGGISHILMPVTTITLFFVAEFAMVVRASMIEALSTDYVRNAEAKGLSPWIVIVRHALRNSLNPVISVAAVNFGGLLGGTVIVENVFAWPGIGLLAVEAVQNVDFPVLQAIVLLLAISVAFITLGADLAQGLFDPRMRLGDQTA